MEVNEIRKQKLSEHWHKMCIDVAILKRARK